MIGRRIGNYEVVRTLGEGGMGVVYLARHTLLGRLSAIKLLLPELSSKQEMVARIFNEARLMAGLNHPGLVAVYDFGHVDGCAYLVMEYLEGETLAQLIDRAGRLPATLAIPLARQIASTVALAHRNGIIHRDLKPDNVFLVPDDETSTGLRARLLDFGIAKLAQERGNAVRTRTGSLVGTPAYMSPEQCRGAGGADIDGRADIYALGCILFEMLCGRRIFTYEGLGEIIAAQLHEIPPPPRLIEPSIPEWIEALIMRCLAKRPDDRPQTMDDMVRLLGTTSGVLPPRPEGKPKASRRRPTPTTFSRASGETIAPGSRHRSRAWWLIAPLALGIAAAGMRVINEERTTPEAPPAPAAVAPPPPPETAAPPPPAVPEPVLAIAPARPLVIPAATVPDAGVPDAAPPDAAPAPAPAPPPAPRPPRRPKAPKPAPAHHDDTLDPYSE